jgi:hypothetical protein
MVNMRGYSGVLLDTLRSERLLVIAPIVFINFFALGYILHGVVFSFKTLELAQVLVCVTLSTIVFFGEFVLLVLPTKVVMDHRIAPQLRTDKEIIRLSFDEQDREVFNRLKAISNSMTLFLTGLVNYFLIALFLFMWFMNDGKPIPAHKVVNGLVPVYLFFIAVNVLAVAYDLVKGKK